MIETKAKQEFIEKVSEILSRKNFTEKAKDNLLKAFLFALENYHPPKYIKTTLQEYIKSYLQVLEELNGYATIELSELNEENEAAEYFRESIRENTSQTGNLDYVDGKYIPSENGKFECACKGYAQNSEKQFFSLNENNPIEEIITIIHEMTHLTEGKYPFLVDSDVPLSFDLRKMFSEGRAATKEGYIKEAVSYVETEYIESSMDFYRFQSKCSYPLYHQLYQTLQIILGDEFLEEMSKNMDVQMDMITGARKRFPDIPVDEIFAHLVYILSCKSKVEHSVLVGAIHDCARVHSKKLEAVQEQIMAENRNLEFCKNSFHEAKGEEERIRLMLETPDVLKEEYEKARKKERKHIEELFQEGHYDEATYRSELKKLEQVGTIEYYREIQMRELTNIKDMQEWTKSSINECMESIKELEAKKRELESNHFALVLERVCLKNPSLNASLTFLQETALSMIQEESKGMTEKDEQYAITLDKMKTLFEIELARTSKKPDKKTNGVL